MTNKNSSDTTTDCPLCRGKEVQPEYTVNNLFNSDSIGLRSRVTWRLSGTTLLQTVEASYTSDSAGHYDEDFTPELNYTIPIHGLGHCPCCRRRLVESIADNDRMEITRPAKKDPQAPVLNPLAECDAKKVKKAWSDVLNSNLKKENPEC
jgi:hypothetical protein